MGAFMSSLLICFIGVDGSGKTSHASRLALCLSKKGYSCKYVKLVSRPILLYFFLIFTKLCGYWGPFKKGVWLNPIFNAPKSVAKNLGKIYRLLLLVDYALIIFWKVILPMRFKKVIICDRYVFDVIIELTLSNLLTQRFAKVLLFISPLANAIFFLKASPTDINKRRPDFSPEYLIKKQKIYQNLLKLLNLNFYIIDTSKSFNLNQLYIRKLTQRILSLG
jgi:dTMP kinase